MIPLGAHKSGSENESGVVTLEVGLLKENFGKHWCCTTRWDPYVDGMFNHCWGTKVLPVPIFFRVKSHFWLIYCQTRVNVSGTWREILELHSEFWALHLEKGHNSKDTSTIFFEISISSYNLQIRVLLSQSLARRNHSHFCHFSEVWLHHQVIIVACSKVFGFCWTLLC